MNQSLKWFCLPGVYNQAHLVFQAPMVHPNIWQVAVPPQSHECWDFVSSKLENVQHKTLHFADNLLPIQQYSWIPKAPHLYNRLVISSQEYEQIICQAQIFKGRFEYFGWNLKVLSSWLLNATILKELPWWLQISKGTMNPLSQQNTCIFANHKLLKKISS